MAIRRGIDKWNNAPPILLAYVNQRAFTHSGAQSARHFFGLSGKPTLADMAALAEGYPVFEIQPVEQT